MIETKRKQEGKKEFLIRDFSILVDLEDKIYNIVLEFTEKYQLKSYELIGILELLKIRIVNFSESDEFEEIKK